MEITTEPTRGRGRPRLYATPEEAKAAKAVRKTAREADRKVLRAIAKADAETARQKPIEVLLMTMDQAAQALQVSTRTIWNLVQDGRLSSVKIAGTRRVHSDDLRHLASTGTV